MSSGQPEATEDRLTAILELLHNVQEESNAWAGDASSEESISAGLAAAVETLSCGLAELARQGFLKAALAAPAGCHVAADLQQIYCHGSILTRLCTRDAVTHTPADVAGFMIGLREVLGAFPNAAVDYGTLKVLAVHVDSVVEAASPLHFPELGPGSLALQILHEVFVGVAAICVTEPGAAQWWGLSPASPALESMLHLALRDLSTACQLAEEPLGSPVGLPTRSSQEQAGQTQPSADQDKPAALCRVECAVLLLTNLLPVAEAAAEQGRLNLQRLMNCAPGLIKFVDLYGNLAGQLMEPQLRMLQLTMYSLTNVFNLQRRLLLRLQALSRRPASKPAIVAALEQRMQWVEATLAFTKLLHKAADAAAAGQGLGEGGNWCVLEEAVVTLAGTGLQTASTLDGQMYPSTSGGPGLFQSLGTHPTALAGRGQPAFSRCLVLVQLAELLVRLVPKRSVLARVRFSRAAGEAQLSETRAHLLSIASWMAIELLATTQTQQEVHMPPQQAPDSSSSSSSSRNGSNAVPEVEILLHHIASLAGTAAKLCRCLPDLATLDPGDARRGVPGSSFHYTTVVETVAKLCCQVLALNPHLVEASGPQRSLTRHLQSTGFVTFLCLPALAQAHGAMHPYDRATMTEGRESGTMVGSLVGLITQLGDLRLIDDAVRGGGLGSLLSQCLQNLLAPRHLGKAASLLVLLVRKLAAEHTEGLAVALVTSGLLQAAAEQSLRFDCKGVRKARDSELQTVRGLLQRHTALLVRAVCSVLDGHGDLLTTFSPRLGDVPTSPTQPPGGRAVYPGGPWVARFGTRQAWEQVCNQLLPALTAACKKVTTNSPAEQQDGIFRDVAVSAWTCCNPDCTDMAGQQEASLALSKCAGCGEARYCSRQCQRQDWRRHKPICQAIRELK